MKEDKSLTKQVQNGEMNGKIVWVCHYNQPDLDKKPLRNVPPTKCIVLSNDELPKNKAVYYSHSHYRALDKSGNPTSKVISPVDNTGYRAIQGNPLHTFDNEAECINQWNDDIEVVLIKLKERKLTIVDEIERKITELSGKIFF